MPSLKDLKNRIGSVKNTQQITKTMKMVAAAKVRRARTSCEAARPYAEKLEGVLSGLAANQSAGGPLMLAGREEVKVVRFVLFGSDRGLCAGFNANLAKVAIERIEEHKAAGKTIQIVCVGRKVRDILKSAYSEMIIETIEDIAKGGLDYTAAEGIGHRLTADFDAGKCDEVHMVYNRFVSMMTQDPTPQSLIPFKASALTDKEGSAPASVEYEPEEEAILATLLPKNLNVQIFRALLESAASEHAARMTAMDNATRNAGEMIKKLSLKYNRTRQANITTELTEIISGAEAL